MAESTVTADSKLTSSDTRRRIWAIVGASSGNLVEWFAYSALFDHGLASKSDQRFASIRSTGNLTFSTAF
ncbi:TPA: hypothetical protein N7A62_004833 [Escherichia coli]|nr:hypothetical protein [Escherichia coli]